MFSFFLAKYFASYFTNLLEAYGESFEHFCQEAMTLHFCSKKFNAGWNELFQSIYDYLFCDSATL